MQSGEYIVDRLLPGMVRAVCAELDINVQEFSKDWVLRLTKGDQRLDIVGYKFGCNSATAAAISQDKVAAHLVLQSVGLPSVPHVLLRSVLSQPVDLAAAEQVLATGPAVLKPLDGTGGRELSLVRSTAEIESLIAASGEPAWALSPWQDIATEQRLIMLDGTIVLAYDKRQPVERHGLKLFNSSAGAQPVIIEPATGLVGLAERATHAIGLRLAAVDIVTLAGGEQRILEVNDGFMLEHFARQSDDYRQTAVAAYRHIIAELLA